MSLLLRTLVAAVFLTACGLIVAATATGGIAVLLLAFRRVHPAHPWFARDAQVRKWPVRLGVAGGLGFAAAGLVCRLVSQGF
ncbi:hypothetical protein ACO1BR_31320 [Streptomyces sp. YGL11-2]